MAGVYHCTRISHFTLQIVDCWAQRFHCREFAIFNLKSHMTANDFRQIALSLPETEERAHMDHPDFRVGGKIFATVGS